MWWCASLPLYENLTICDVVMNCFLQDLRLGSGTTFRFDVRARDLGSPPRSSDPGRVTVFVRRNSNGPYFINTPYIQALERNTTTGKISTHIRMFPYQLYPCVFIYGLGLSVFFSEFSWAQLMLQVLLCASDSCSQLGTLMTRNTERVFIVYIFCCWTRLQIKSKHK